MRLGLSLGKKLADDLAAGGGLGLFVLGHEGERLGAAELPGDVGPGGLAQGRAIIAAAAFDGVKLVADEDGGGGLGDFLDPGGGEDLGHAGPAVGGGAVPGEVEQEGEGVGLAAAELGGQVEDRAGLGPLAGEAADDFGGQGGEVLGEVGAGEEAVGLLVVGRGAVVADVVQVDGEFGGVERFAFAEVFAGRDDFVPGFEGHIHTRQNGYRLLHIRIRPKRALHRSARPGLVSGLRSPESTLAVRYSGSSSPGIGGASGTLAIAASNFALLPRWRPRLRARLKSSIARTQFLQLL